ncbi:phage tail tape measure protein [Rhizobium leguminosarum bv. viciae 248]|uniref:phage tail tape measure protein n=1 Tax=Rhizobium leguminosarum TaxID=384 RepID=UPI0003693B52|nr:phage tail tape measure protein [Rhizobium leguminosarum]QHW25643.1 phage tail tape measure protein [Rhizobium leguminosarum bv. viciae 248]
MARSMTLDVLVRLKDLLSSPLRGLRRSLQGVVDTAKKIGLVGTAIAAISFMQPMKEAAAFQQQLLDIAGTSNKTGAQAFLMVDQLKGRFEDLALSVGQTSDTIAKGSGKMIAAGLDEQLVNNSLKSIGRATRAANAEFDDMAGVAVSLLQTLKLPADQLDATLAGLIVAGKEGSFELRDMAKYFPTLTGQMAKLGITGRTAATQLAAMLEIAKKGTSDSAEAANNLNNFLSKITAPETARNFEKMGVDIQGVMQDAVTKGINPIEAVIQKISTLTGISSKEIDGLMKKAEAGGLKGADALEQVRTQLEAIHGAGALGGLFADMQVMGFLIPMLANVDEYKRIRDRVAEATGAMSDADFDTQMQSLNTQLTIFGEIGTQAWREVGLAFGTWLPPINSGLMTALKWLRDLDASTGGMVKQSLAWAGAGVMVVAALGALGVVLPIIATGLSAVAALISPVGLALAAIAAGAVYIYRNWSSFGPRLTRLWDRAKTGFFQLADGVRERGRRIIDAGREIYTRYAPMVRRGFDTAWRDVQGGLRNLQPFFDSFRKSLKFDIDLSGLSIDNAKLASFKALDLALAGIKAGWEALRDFGSGFAPHLGEIGKQLGGTVNSIAGIASGFGRLATAIGKMIGFDAGKLDWLPKWLGDLAGSIAGELLRVLGQVLKDVETFVNRLAGLAEQVNAGVDWQKLMPTGVVEAWNALAGAINAVKSAMSYFQGNSYAPGDKLPNGGTAGDPDDHLQNFDWMNPLPQAPANNNSPAGAVAPAQAKAVVGGTVTVKVDGPAQVTGVTSDNPAVPLKANTGRSVGRP